MCHNATLDAARCDGDLSFGTVAERIAPESLTPRLILLRSPQHIAQIISFITRSSLPRAGKQRFSGKILKAKAWRESNQKRERVNRDLGRSVIPGWCVKHQTRKLEIPGSMLRDRK